MEVGATVDDIHVQFVLTHHGYYGRMGDFAELRDLIVGAPPSSMHRVVIEGKDNEGFYTDRGISECATLYVRHVAVNVQKTMHEMYTRGSGIPPPPTHTPAKGVVLAAVAEEEPKCYDKGSVDGPFHDGASVSKPTEVLSDSWRLLEQHYVLHFVAIGHSMGGLILRAALPVLQQQIMQAYPEPIHRVSWDVFCTIATPHLGVRYMRSKLKSWVGGVFGARLSTGLADLFDCSDVLRTTLVTPASLKAWRNFNRRVLVNGVNDETVLSYSSSFIVLPCVQARVGHPPSTDAVPKGEGERVLEESITFLSVNGVRCATSVRELHKNATMMEHLTPALWPTSCLTEERRLAECILSAVGPLELHMVDLRPGLSKAAAETGRGGPPLMAKFGAHYYSHKAILCKFPFNYPNYFRFVSEYIAEDIVGVTTEATTHSASAVSTNETIESSYDTEVTDTETFSS